MEQCVLLLQCGNSNQSRMKNRCSFLPVLGNIFLFIVFIRRKEEDDFSRLNYFWANEYCLMLRFPYVILFPAFAGTNNTGGNYDK